MATHDTIPVIFRAEKSGEFKGQVTAVLPSIECGYSFLQCYAHIGQHHAGSMGWYLRTRAARPSEYASLLAELQSIYEPDVLRVMKRLITR